MVPHEALEHKIITALGFDAQAERPIAIVGVTDGTKGEAKKFCSAPPTLTWSACGKLRAGVPNLDPKQICRCDAIPVLASGKLDLTRCKSAAEECNT
jgi:acyl-[acyl-carrier-protein]-phospholipid O-acyltransferase/long-chain-fatty-acid--[acyl-carrier-protein] ligase